MFPINQFVEVIRKCTKMNASLNGVLAFLARTYQWYHLNFVLIVSYNCVILTVIRICHDKAHA